MQCIHKYHFTPYILSSYPVIFIAILQLWSSCQASLPSSLVSYLSLFQPTQWENDKNFQSLRSLLWRMFQAMLLLWLFSKVDDPSVKRSLICWHYCITRKVMPRSKYCLRTVPTNNDKISNWSYILLYYSTLLCYLKSRLEFNLGK